jgi:hypothetical protein
MQANSIASDVKGKTPIFSKALKTVSTVRSFLPGRRSNMSISFTNSSSHGDQNSVIREIACHHRRRNRLSLGDISTGSYAKGSFSIGDEENREKNVQFNDNNDQENVNEIGMNHVKFAKFPYIITRPTTYLKDGPSLKKVSASKSVRTIIVCFKVLRVQSNLFICQFLCIVNVLATWTISDCTY